MSESEDVAGGKIGGIPVSPQRGQVPRLESNIATGVGGEEPVKTPGPSDWVTEGSLVRVMWKLALPMMAGVALQDVFSLVDMMWVGKLGPKAVASVSLSGTLLGVSFMIAFGISVGCLALVARMIGMRNPRDAGRVIGQAITTSVVLSMIMAAIGIFFAEDLMRMMGAQDEVIELGARYLRISAMGSIIVFQTFVLTSALRAAADAMTPLIVTVIANIINIILDPLLIFGWAGMPKLGVSGSAIATVIAQFVSLSIMLYVFFIKGHHHLVIHKSDLKPDWGIIWRIFRIGVFGSGQALVRNLSALALVGIVTSFGMRAMAAYGIVIRIWFATVMLGTGLGAAAATMIGQNLGAGLPDRAAKSGWMATGLFGIFGLLSGIIFVGFAEPLVRIFNDNAEVLDYGSSFIRLIGYSQIFTCISVVLGRAFQGAGDALSPLIITASALLIIRIPLAYWLAGAWESVDGVWVAIATSNVLQGLLFAIWFAVGTWKTKNV